MFIREIRLQNLLSFGPDTPPLELRPLNVLIGPNGSGKSNLIEAISLLQAAPRDISEPIRKGGSADEWIWKGRTYPDVSDQRSLVMLEATIKRWSTSVTHKLSFERMFNSQLAVNEHLTETKNDETKTIYDSYLDEATVFNGDDSVQMALAAGDVFQSVCAIRGIPFKSSVVDHLAIQYEKIRIYRDIDTSRESVLRKPQRADERNEFLSESLDNFGLVLSRLRRDAQSKQDLLAMVAKLNLAIKDFDLIVEGGTVQVFLQEDQYTIPAVRLSDGTLRFLCLLLVLCHPKPPPLICIEEPELGLHPDMLPTVARLLKEASQRTQLIVTTHSDILIDALSSAPEDVIVCEKHDGCTTMKRLVADDLKIWLEKYSLGNLWTSGQIGGNRW